jgi:hypothetical protein
MKALATISLREEPITGMELYNLLIVAHQLDRSGVIKMAYETYAQLGPLPKPDPSMVLDPVWY